MDAEDAGDIRDQYRLFMTPALVVFKTTIIEEEIAKIIEFARKKSSQL